MSLTFWFVVAFILLLILISAFFSGSETALTAASKARLLQLEKNGDHRAKLAGVLIEARERLIGTLLLGNNLVNILASSLATSLFMQLFGETGVIYATICMTFFVVVFAEVLPKTYAITYPDKFALTVAPIIRPIVSALTPFVKAVEWMVSGILRLMTRSSQQEPVISGLDEIRGAVDLLHMEGSVVKDDRDMLDGLLDLRELVVSDVMVHRTDIVAVNLDDPIERILEKILANPYTRLPVWQNEPDNIVGIIHTRDIMRAIYERNGSDKEIDLLALASKPWYAPETAPLQNQLTAFLKNKSHIAIVVDEYGEMQGLVTLEDIIEEIVGNISDEHDTQSVDLKPESDGSYILDGSTPIRDLNRIMDWDLPEDEATTLAGLIIHETQMIPEEEQVFNFYGFRFMITHKEKHRISEISLKKLYS